MDNVNKFRKHLLLKWNPHTYFHEMAPNTIQLHCKILQRFYCQKSVKDTLTEDYWKITLPNDLATSAARSPSLFAYYAVLNLLDARGLFPNIKVSELLEAGIRSKKSALERHHLYPREYLKRTGITETRDINQIANYALVEWTDNIDISDQPPSEYVPKYLNRFNKDEIKAMYYCHDLPDNWETMKYEEFLNERRKKITIIVRDGFNQLQ